MRIDGAVGKLSAGDKLNKVGGARSTNTLLNGVSQFGTGDLFLKDSCCLKISMVDWLSSRIHVLGI